MIARKNVRSISNRTSVVFLVLTSTLAFCPAVPGPGQPVALQKNTEGERFASFQCPEEYTSDAAKQAALKEFIQAYAQRFPRKNVRDMALFRYRLLVDHSCVQTLKSMLTDVGRITQMLRFENDDSGPRTEEYNTNTRVWTVWFRKDGEPPELSDEDLIVNFYGWPGPSPETVADAFARPRESVQVIGKFQAPDELTKKPAFFILSETLYSDEQYGYVNISKITSVGSGTCTVTLAKKIRGDSVSDVDRNAKAWFLSDEGKAASRTLGRIGIDRSWEEYFADKKR